ncbi:MAG: hypothetical protein JKY65_18880 [Planctomycetes bacterium]|nr:hypothetical protein [Planctomycetota bacterium]
MRFYLPVALVVLVSSGCVGPAPAGIYVSQQSSFHEEVPRNLVENPKAEVVLVSDALVYLTPQAKDNWGVTWLAPTSSNAEFVRLRLEGDDLVVSTNHWDELWSNKPSTLRIKTSPSTPIYVRLNEDGTVNHLRNGVLPGLR